MQCRENELGYADYYTSFLNSDCKNAIESMKSKIKHVNYNYAVKII